MRREMSDVNNCWPTLVGMRRSSAETKAVILAAAKERFAESGFERATIRAIAADANIDPSMVMRYFGSKDQLFAAAADFDLQIPDLSGLDPADVGARVVDYFMERWERDEALVVLLRSSTSNEEAANRMREIFAEQLMPAIAALNPVGRSGAPAWSPRRCWAWRCVATCCDYRRSSRCRMRKSCRGWGRRFSATCPSSARLCGMSVVARRAGAALAAISAALHAVMLGHSGNAASAVLVAVMNLAMVAVRHLPVSGSHHVTHVVVEAVVPHSVVMTIAMALSMIEVVVAVAVLCYRSRGNARVIGRGN